MLRDRGVCVAPLANECMHSWNQQIFKSDSHDCSPHAQSLPSNRPARLRLRRPSQSADMHPTVQNVLAWFAGAVVSIPANMMLLEPMGKLLGAPPAPNVRLRGVILLMHFHSFHCTSSFLLLSSMHPINATQALTSQPAITMSITFSTVDAPLWSMAREGTL
jgi:hypothetical protein